jgi:MSHA pilin protein MshC
MQTVPWKDSRGLTFLEVITVIALISTLALVVVTRQRSSNNSLPARIKILKTHVRYAQSRAMNSDTVWGVQIGNSGTTYRLFNNVNVGLDRNFPGEKDGAVDLSLHGLSAAQATFIVSFDGWGRPCSDTSGASPYNGDQTITLTDGQGNSQSLVITRNTGLVR